MSSPNISKNNIKSTLSKRDEKSYLERYRNRNKLQYKFSGNLQDSIEASCIEDEIWDRSDRLFELYNSGQSLENIKIEEEEGSQIMRNEYMETEILWLEKIGETKHDIVIVKQNCEKESKLIKQMEKELTNKRIKLTQILQKLDKANSEYQEVYIETYQHEIDNLQSQYDSVWTSGEEIIAEATQERDALLAQNKAQDKEIQAILDQINELSQFESEAYHNQLSSLIDEEERLKTQISQMELQMDECKKSIKNLDDNKPIPQENHRKYLQLYQKIYINKQLDLMEELLSNKHREIQRLQDYQKKKAVYKLKRGQIEDREKSLEEQQKTMQSLEEEIRQKSTILLNLYQYESQKINR